MLSKTKAAVKPFTLGSSPFTLGDKIMANNKNIFN